MAGRTDNGFSSHRDVGAFLKKKIKVFLSSFFPRSHHQGIIPGSGSIQPCKGCPPTQPSCTQACCCYQTSTVSAHFGEMSIWDAARASSGSRPQGQGASSSLCLLQILLSMLGASNSKHFGYQADGETSPRWVIFVFCFIYYTPNFILLYFSPTTESGNTLALAPSQGRVAGAAAWGLPEEAGDCLGSEGNNFSLLKASPAEYFREFKLLAFTRGEHRRNDSSFTVLYRLSIQMLPLQERRCSAEPQH